MYSSTAARYTGAPWPIRSATARLFNTRAMRPTGKVSPARTERVTARARGFPCFLVGDSTMFADSLLAAQPKETGEGTESCGKGGGEEGELAHKVWRVEKAQDKDERKARQPTAAFPPHSLPHSMKKFQTPVTGPSRTPNEFNASLGLTIWEKLQRKQNHVGIHQATSEIGCCTNENQTEGLVRRGTTNHNHGYHWWGNQTYEDLRFDAQGFSFAVINTSTSCPENAIQLQKW